MNYRILLAGLKYCGVCIGVLWFIACKEKSNIEKAKAYYEEIRGEGKSYVSDSVKITCVFLTKDYLALNEIRNEITTVVNVDSVIKIESEKFSNSLYFEYVITPVSEGSQSLLHKGVASNVDYANRISELTYNLQRDLFIKTDEGDTLRMTGYNFENTYGMGPGIKFIGMFPRKFLDDQSNKFDLIYEDKTLGFNKPIAIRFKKSDIKDLPSFK